MVKAFFAGYQEKY